MALTLTRYDTPLLMRYEGLDPRAKYRIRVVYSSPFSPVIRLVADGRYEIHSPLQQPKTIRPLEFDIPRDATRDGNLSLQWHLMNLRRGIGVGEVCLIKRLDQAPELPVLTKMYLLWTKSCRTTTENCTE